MGSVDDEYNYINMESPDFNHSIAEIVAVCLVSPGPLVITVYAQRCLPSVSSPRADFIHKESKLRFGLGYFNECTVVLLFYVRA